jgi:hypothetical protein
MRMKGAILVQELVIDLVTADMKVGHVLVLLNNLIYHIFKIKYINIKTA